LQKADPGDFARQLRLDGERRAEEAEGKGHEDSNCVKPSDSPRLVAPSMLGIPWILPIVMSITQSLRCRILPALSSFSPPVLQRQPNAK